MRSRLLLKCCLCECQQWLSIPCSDAAPGLSWLYPHQCTLSLAMAMATFPLEGRCPRTRGDSMGAWCGPECELGRSWHTSQEFQMAPNLLTLWTAVMAAIISSDAVPGLSWLCSPSLHRLLGSGSLCLAGSCTGARGPRLHAWHGRGAYAGAVTGNQPEFQKVLICFLRLVPKSKQVCVAPPSGV